MMSATGDLQNNLLALQKILKSIRFPIQIDVKKALDGNPKQHLEVLHFAFLDYSQYIAQYIATKGCKLYGKTDIRFLESVFRYVREEYNYLPVLTPSQFLTANHFAERKIILVKEILSLVQSHHQQIKSQQRRAKAAWRKPPEPSSLVERFIPSSEEESKKALWTNINLNQQRDVTLHSKLFQLEDYSEFKPQVVKAKERIYHDEYKEIPEYNSAAYEASSPVKWSDSSHLDQSYLNSNTSAQLDSLSEAFVPQKSEEMALNESNTGYNKISEIDTNKNSFANAAECFQKSEEQENDCLEAVKDLQHQISEMTNMFMEKFLLLESKIERIEDKMSSWNDRSLDNHPMRKENYTEVPSNNVNDDHKNLSESRDNSKLHDNISWPPTFNMRS